MPTIKPTPIILYLIILLFTIHFELYAAEPVLENKDKENIAQEISPEVNNLFSKAKNQMKNKEYIEALKNFGLIINQNSLVAGPHVNRGIIFYGFDDFISAETEFKWAIQKNPNSTISYVYLGLIEKQKGNFAGAKIYYEKAKTISPDYSLAYYNLGILCDLFLKDIECALANYKKYDSLTNKSEKPVGIWIADLESKYDVIKQQQLAQDEARKKAEEEAKLTPEQLQSKRDLERKNAEEAQLKLEKEKQKQAELEEERLRAEERKQLLEETKLKQAEEDKIKMLQDEKAKIEAEKVQEANRL
ncbi:MAG: hypothetical protein QM538_07030, partial [Methylacidiphilales bacterium]|nr:hypothetical protein [Candidatus Methylacidiphilales bacterium]